MSEPLLGEGWPDVRASHDAGACYCAHVFYLAHEVALRPGCSLARDALGEPLLGFLHVPRE